MKLLRWHRVVSTLVALVMALALVAFWAQPALAISQTWYMIDTASGSNYVMNRGITGGGGTAIAVISGYSMIWVADEAAALDVSYAAGDWTGQLLYSITGSKTLTDTVEIGVWDGSGFTSHGITSNLNLAAGNRQIQAFTISAGAFTVPQTDWLAWRINHTDSKGKSLSVLTNGVSDTYVSSPSTEPGYPSPWESYREVGHTNVWGTLVDPYDATYNTAYMYGDGFEAGHTYAVGFYDMDGNKASGDVSGTLSGTTLSAEKNLSLDTNRTAGTWHAVVFDTAEGSPPVIYAECSGAAGYRYEDDFEVSDSAIPELSTVLGAIGLAGLCFGVYYWMRKRRLAYVKA